MNDTPIYFAGVDWASEKHHVWLTDASGERLGERVFAHGGEGLAEMCAWLLATSGAAPGQLLIAIETPHGPVVETLLDRGFDVYALNPKQLDRFRDRFTLAGAKDDSRDAETMASALRTDRRAFRRLAFDDPAIVELREWSRLADDLSAERGRLANRLREQLWRYYPQMLDLGADLSEEWLLDLWSAAPAPADVARLRRGAIERILKRHRIRRIDAAQALAVLRQPAVTVGPGVAEAATAHVRLLAERLRVAARQLRQAHRRIDELCAALCWPSEEQDEEPEPARSDAAILLSLPGVGRIVLATLLAEASDALRRRDRLALRALCGVAPVTRRSGKSRIVLRRFACHPRLRNALYHWARVAAQRDPASKARYAALRARGHGHARALRTIGDRLIATACAMLRTRTLFNPSLAVPKNAC